MGCFARPRGHLYRGDRRPPASHRWRTAAVCVAAVVGGRTPSCCSLINSCGCRVPVARAAVVVRRPRPIGGKTTAECIVTVGGSRTCCCCFPVNSCWRSPPGVRAGLSRPLPIYAGVVVLLPCPTGGKFVAECIVAATGALPPPRWVPIDGCSSRPSDGRARTSSAVATG